MKKLVRILLLILLISIPNKLLNAQTWLPSLAQGVDDAPLAFVEAIIEFEGDIIITGEFASVSGVPCAYVARWNGSTWTAMGSGLPAVGRCLAIYNGELYAGLDAIGSPTLQKWDGSNWVASGPFTDPILTLYVDPSNNDFYAGGYFTSPGKFIAKLNGTTWQGMGNLDNGTSSFPGVKAINVYNGQLYVGGTFGGGAVAQYVAVWTGSTFEPLHADQPNQPVTSFAQQDGLLYIAGAFSRIGPLGNPNTRCVARWDGSQYIPLTTDQSGPNTALGGVKSIVSYKNQIYAIGAFSIISVSGIEANNIARYNNCQWKNLTDGVNPVGINGEGNTLTVIGDNLYMGGAFTEVGGSANNKRIASWNNAVECPDPFCFPASPSISITASSTFGCIGSTFDFTANVVSGGTSPTYVWMVDGTQVGTNSSTFSSSSLNDGQVVTCDLISNDACMSNPNASSNPIQVSIVTQVTPTITITADNPVFCFGSTVNFTSSATFVGTNPTYQWMVNGVNAGTNSSTFSSTSFSDGDIVTCQVASSESCASPINVSSNSVTLTMTSAITPSITIITTTPVVCSGQSVTFTSTHTGGGSTPSYQWKRNGTNVGTNSSTFTSSTLTNNDVITCEITSSDACASPATVTSNSINITVNQSVTPTISITASQSSICPGDNVIFTSAITNGGTSPTYQWQINGTNAGNTASFSTSSLTNGQTVSCILTSSLACSSSATSNTITITVNTPSNPSVTISSNSNNICVGSSVVFTAVGTNAGTSPVYNWFHNNVPVGTNSSSFTTTNLQNGDFVFCVLEGGSSCGGSATSDMSNYVVMNVITEATVDIQGTSLVSLTTGSSYQWVDCSTGVDVPGATSSTFVPSEVGNYKVVVQVNSCEVESQCYPIFVQAALSENGFNPIFVAPNPSVGIFNVSVNDAVIYQITDLNGALIQSNSVENDFIIDLSMEESGVYFLRVVTEKNQQINFYKLIKN